MLYCIGMRYLFGFLGLVVAIGCAAPTAWALTPTQRYLGYMVISADTPEAVWYVDPRRKERVPATTLTDIRTILRTRAAKVKVADLKRLPLVGTLTVGDLNYRRQLAGRYIVVTDRKNEAWYITPRTKRRIRIGNGQVAVTFARSQALTISAADLAEIPAPPNIRLVTGSVKSSRGSFTTERLEFAWNDPGIRIMTDTANTSDCKGNCPVISLGSYISRRAAVAGIHGTYFCPQDYGACATKRNSYDFPVWNSFTKSWRNEGRIKYTSQPIVAFDTSNRPFLYAESRQFKSQAGFAATFADDSIAAGGTGVLQAAFSNGPMLIRNGVYVLKGNQLDTKQATVKSARGVLGWKGTTMVFFVVHGATVTDAASVAQALGLENAVNLDGGGSTAMYTAGRYILGPGRNLPNAILITRR